MKKSIEVKVASMTVVELRTVANKQYGIKNVTRYKRSELSQMVVEAMIAEEEATKVRPTVAKRVKSEKVEESQVEELALQLIAKRQVEDLIQCNRKVLIEAMKKLHVKRWYRIYDKETMVSKLTCAFGRI